MAINETPTTTTGVVGPFYQHIDDIDIVEDQSKVTTGFFTGNVGTLAGSNLTTASLSATQKKYYYNLQYSSADQLSVAYGHLGGSGSVGTDGSLDNLEGETEAVYKYFANMTMDDDFSKQGFVFDSGSDGSTVLNPEKRADGDRGEPGMYFIVAERNRMKDRINKGTWTLQLSASNTAGAPVAALNLTDDSAYTDGGATSTVAGPRYNIVSGSAGNRNSKTPVHGFFYPNLGLWAMRESTLSASAAGTSTTAKDDTTLGLNATSGGLAANLSIGGKNNTNAIKLVNALRRGTHTLRAEEDQTTTSYFCRARATQFNATNNPTWLSGSSGRLSNLAMEGALETYITTVGLYDSSYKLVAVGRLSKSIKKTFKTESTVKVNLTF
tara:strand:- start:1032 stop:2177 length:1146 start_codon:yes stop_codon:yes gene_type:complete